MRRIIFLFLLIAALAPGTWLREPPRRISTEQSLRLAPLPVPNAQQIGSRLGPFRLEAVWHLTSPNSDFGGYSSLLPIAPGRFLAISDRGSWLRFAMPGALPAAQPRFGQIAPGDPRLMYDRDSESATMSADGRTVWIGWEARNAISRHDPELRGLQGITRPAAMRDWASNSGPEAIARLADGRFLVLAEGYNRFFENRRHWALAFTGDPVANDGRSPVRFTFEGPTGFMPTDMAQLPDGRVLVLMRNLIWPFPLRFSGRIVLLDPADIHPGALVKSKVLALLQAPLPVDNFEGMAIVPEAGGRVAVWLISDDNAAMTQRTLLWKLSLDPATLPPASKKAREKPPRPSAS